MIALGAIFLSFFVVVFVHETGHLLMAKWFGFEVTEFSIGFWKSLFSFEYKGCSYSLRIVPLGGYVKIKGFSDKPNSPTSKYWSKPAWQRFLVMAADIFSNLIFSFILIFSFASHSPKLNKLEGKSRLEKTGYVLKRLAMEFLSDLGNTETYTKGGQHQLFYKAYKENAKSMQHILLILGLISFVVGFVNIIPFPALDGGHLLFGLLEMVSGRKPPSGLFEAANIIGFLLLAGFSLYSIARDLVWEFMH